MVNQVILLDPDSGVFAYCAYIKMNPVGFKVDGQVTRVASRAE
jgi:hypothetical protein